ncbi:MULTISPECIES: hypothetical protein [Micrococcaceae]|uniref:Uncharacterized protein n=1 Tax=Arthrobacter sp. AK-1 TaxID=415095 RepID=A6YFK4_9MICC|nr:hypothetical protein [Arthrobacter sp. AK-1]ABR67008.1 unknown [Arthrobacter sp. AK-1]
MKLKDFFQSRRQATAVGPVLGPTAGEVALPAVEPGAPLSAEELVDMDMQGRPGTNSPKLPGKPG